MINDYVLDKDGNMYLLIPRTLTEINGISDNDGLVIKINSAGASDNTFNGKGYAVVHNMTLTPSWQQPYRWGNYLRVSGDGSEITVYAGTAGNTINTYRLTRDGLPDYSYGDKGCKNITLPASESTLQDIRMTANDGVLLYNCRTVTSDSLLFSITKLDADGNIDLSFNTAGTVNIELAGDINTPYYVESLSLPSGGFLMETKTARYNFNDFLDVNWVKITANGFVDSSYGNNGVATIPIDKYTPLIDFASAHSILLPDSSLLSMLMYPNGYYRLFQFKLTPAGIIDSSYGTNGMSTTNFGNTNNFIGRYSDPGGLNFWASRSTTDSAGYVAMRIRPDGYIDSSFIHTSRISDPFYQAGYNNQFDSYSLVSGQNIIGALTYGVNGLLNNGTLSIVRLDQHAVIDPTFGVNGKILLTNGVSNDQLLNAVPLSDGRMLGIASDGVQERLFRVTKDGHSDKSFGNGQQLVNLDKRYYPPSGTADIQADGNNRIVVAALRDSVNIINQLVLSRYTADGQLDPTFGQGGYIILNNQLNPYKTLIYKKFIFQSDNKILLLYTVNDVSSSTSAVGVSRLNENGTIDNTFGNNGWSYFNYAFDRPETFTVLRDGSILISGTYEDGTKQYVTKLNSSGQQQTTPGTNGFVFTVQGTADDHVFFLSETDSGKIVYALTGRDYTNLNYTLAGRLNSDLSYDQNAKLTYITGDRFSSAQLLHDGRLVLAGMHNMATAPPHLAMTVTKSDLSIDSLFGDNGVLTYPDVLPDTLTQTNPYSDPGTDENRGYSYNQVFCFKDATGQIVTAATAKKDSLGDIFLIRHLFDDTAKTYIPPPAPPANGSLVVWTRALCPKQGFIKINLYDSTGAIVLMPGSTAILFTTLKTAPACNGYGAYTYTVPTGIYTLKAFCGSDSLVSTIAIVADSCTTKDVTFSAPPVTPPVTPPITPPGTAPSDTTSTNVPIDSTVAPRQITIFPNPTHGAVDIRLPGPDNGSILVADMTGRIIWQIAFSGQDVKVDLTRLEKGYYMVWVKGRQYTRTLSVLKL